MNTRISLLTVSLFLLSACDNNPAISVPKKDNSEALNQYIQQIKSNLVFVQGGDFLMGDFGEEYGKEHLPYDAKQDSKPLHKVELTSYSISKFKTSNKEYQFYLSYNNVVGRKVDKNSYNGKRWNESNNMPETPAHVGWDEAEKYCEWLSTVTNFPFALPTEAQWEYAARSRGKFVIAPTNDGAIQIENRKGINVTSEDDREKYSYKIGSSLGIASPMPRDVRPPNPLGIYDMSGNGWEWIKDWYDPDYYQYSPVKDPQGPEKPVFRDYKGNFTKVIRSQDYSGPGRGLTVTRFNFAPDNGGYLPMDKTVRCVVNSPNPIK